MRRRPTSRLPQLAAADVGSCESSCFNPSSCSRIRELVCCSDCNCCPWASRSGSISSRLRFVPWPLASFSHSPPSSSPFSALLPFVVLRCESFVTHFIGVVTTESPGSRNKRLVSAGETRTRKRCLSRCEESEVILSLKRAEPCKATTSVLPTNNGSQVASCSTSWPFSYKSSA